MKIFLGSDHGGFNLKQKILKYLRESNFEAIDCGCFSTDSCDYPDFAKVVCKAALEQNCFGILVCGTGIGMSISANKIKGIRAAHCANSFEAKMSREHNNANVLCLGERVIGEALAFEIVEVWLKTNFSNEEKHLRRINKIE